MRIIGLFEITLQTSFLILLILSIRKAFGEKLHPWVMKCLWGILAVRMLIPVQIPVDMVGRSALGQAAEAFERWLADGIWGALFSGVWLAGMGAVLLLFGLKNLQFIRSLKKNRSIYGKKDGILVYFVDGKIGSCLEGLFWPKIYISRLAEERLEWCNWIVRHELYHYHELDNWYSFFRNLCLAVYWYNPLVWYAAKCTVEDCEIACDYGVLADKGREEGIVYGKCLLAMAANKPDGFVQNVITGNSLSDGSLRRRLQRIGQEQFYSSFLEIILAAAVLLLTAGCFLGRDTEGRGVMELAAKLPLVRERMVCYTLENPERMEEMLDLMNKRKRLQHGTAQIVRLNEEQMAVWFPLSDSYTDYGMRADRLAFNPEVCLTCGEAEYRFEVTEDILVETKGEKGYMLSAALSDIGIEITGDYDVFYGGGFQCSGSIEEGMGEYILLCNPTSFDAIYDKKELLLEKNPCGIRRAEK